MPLSVELRSALESIDLRRQVGSAVLLGLLALLTAAQVVLDIERARPGLWWLPF